MTPFPLRTMFSQATPTFNRDAAARPWPGAARASRATRWLALGSSLALLLAGCAGVPGTRPQRMDSAQVDVQIVAQAIQIERETDARSSTPPAPGEPWFAVLSGTAPIIVTAPHATRPTREGRLRFSDGGGTAALAQQLHRITGATAIYTTHAAPVDANYDDDNEFKSTLAQLITTHRPLLVIDLHGSHAYRPYDVDIGTMRGASLQGQERVLADLSRALQREGLLNLSFDYFAAERNATITKFAAAMGVPALQLEINATWLTPSQGDLMAHRYAQLVQALVRYVEQRKDQPRGLP